MMWDYKVEKVWVNGLFKPDVKPEELERVLDELGAQEWELVSAIDVNTGNGATIEVVLFLKRPRVPRPPPPLPTG